MSAEERFDFEFILHRFRKLLGEVTRGVIGRNSFQPWEVEILMDLENCRLNPRRRLVILRQYQGAVERQLAIGPGPPMKLSEFLARRAGRNASDGAF